MGGKTLAEAHRAGFNERLGRIHAGGPNTAGKILIGPGEEIRAKDAKKLHAQMKKRQKSGAPEASIANQIISMPFAFAIGVIAVFAGRVASWQFMTPGGPFADRLPLPSTVAGIPLTLFADLAIAAVLALLLAWTFKFTVGLKRLGVVLGFGAMLSGEVFLIERFPDVFANFYAEDFVAAAPFKAATQAQEAQAITSFF